VRRVERFAKALRRETNVPVHLVDESFSSREAEERVKPGRRGSDADRAHAAAAVILQRWLDRPRAGGDRG
jgi:RNase H-fold protein (predicted Holliday junction resolvase)